MPRVSRKKESVPHVRDTVRQARTDLYRQHILTAAERVFADRGFEAARLQEIGEIAQLSMGTIYAIFPSKQEIFAAILEERGKELLAVAEQAAEVHEEPLAALRALIAGYIDWFVTHPDFLRMHLRLGTPWILTPPSSAETQVRNWTRVQELQAEIFARGIAAGVFLDEDPRYLGKVFSAMDQILLAEWVESGMKQSRDDLVRRLQSVSERAFRR